MSSVPFCWPFAFAFIDGKSSKGTSMCLALFIQSFYKRNMNVLFIVPYAMSRGSTEAVMMNLIRNFSSDVRVDVIEITSSKKGLYDEELKPHGKGSIYYISSEKHFHGYIRG